MADKFVVPSLEPDSPFLRAALNERWTRVWSYWGPGEYPTAAAEKADIEQHVAAILRDNDADAVMALAREDDLLRNGMVGPREFDLNTEALRLGAFRLLEIELSRTQERLRLQSLEPARADDVVCQLTPGLWSVLTKRDRLFPLTRESLSKQVGNDPFFLHLDRAVFPHPFIRGARELLGDLMFLGFRGSDVKIALDPVRAQPAAEAQVIFLADYWFGCRLRRSDLDDPRHVGETWHVRPLDRPVEFGLKPLAATVFRWSLDGTLKTLEIDEIEPADETEADGPYRINRYLHAVRDINVQRFVHVDGAVRAYDESRYAATRADPKGDRGDVVHYRKLFRVDDVIDDDIWGHIVAHFFRGNELVIEYFGELLDERSGTAAPAA